jgi:hypothetical protein
VRGRFVGHQFDRPLQRHDRLGRTIEGQETDTGEQARGAKRRIEARRSPKLNQRVGVAAALLQDETKIVVDKPALAALAEQVTKDLLGVVQVASLEGRDAFGESRRERRREILC